MARAARPGPAGGPGADPGRPRDAEPVRQHRDGGTSAPVPARRRERGHPGHDWYEQSCAAVAKVRRLLDPSELIDFRYESFLEQPTVSLAELCRFVGVEPGDAYLEACSGLVWPSAKKTRDSVEWTEAEREEVERLIERYDLLDSYSFDE